MESVDRLMEYVEGYCGCDKGRKELVELIDAIEHEIEERYMPLPVDADGMPIRLGDVMEAVCKYDTLREVTGEVITIHFDSMDDGLISASVGLCVWAEDGKSFHNAFIDPFASVYRHHRDPTVEDVLVEFARAYGIDAQKYTDTIAEYAAKLRLAEGD